MIDTHIHLDSTKYKNDLPEVIKRAKQAGVNYFINPGSNLESNEKIINLIRLWRKEIIPAFGIHPHDASKFNDEIYENIKKYCQTYKAVAVGETGLDFHYNFSKQDVQIDVFKKHIQLAQELDLPIIIHCRKAENQVYEILKDKNVRGVIHCFSGNWEEAQKFLDLGFYLGVTGVVTFPKAFTLQEVVKKTPLERLLVETDGPYLAPVPHRGKRNEPAYIILVAEKIVEIKKVSREAAKEQLNKNAKICFNL